MGLFVDQPSGDDGDDLVHAIGELIATILDMDGRLMMRNIATIYISVPLNPQFSSSHMNV